MTKLDKLRNEQAKATEKARQWSQKAEELAQKITEEEKTVIHEMVTSANMTPEQLAELLAQMNGNPSGEEGVHHEME